MREVNHKLDINSIESIESGATLTVTGSSFIANEVMGGKGNDADTKSVAGNGGRGFASAIATYGIGCSTLVSGCVFMSNQSFGGPGGNGGTKNAAGVRAVRPMVLLVSPAPLLRLRIVGFRAIRPMAALAAAAAWGQALMLSVSS
jgi:hypothetical protein